MGRNLFDFPLLLLGLVGFAAAGWWTVYSGPNSADKLEARLYDAITEDMQFVDLDWVSLRPDGQRMIIFGTAPTPDLQQFATDFVLSAVSEGGPMRGGVTHVIDQTTLAPPVEPYIWQAEKQVELSLSGHVPSVALREALHARAGELSEVPFESDLVLANGAVDADWPEIVTTTLEQIGRLQSGEAYLEGNQLTVSGVAPNLRTLTEVENVFGSLPATYEVSADISPPDLWWATIERDRLTFEGRLRSERFRRDISVVTDRFFEGDVIDQAVTDDGVPQAVMQGVRLAWPRFLQFSNGRFVYNREGFRIEGVAPAALIEQLRLDMARLPENLEVDLQAEAIETALPELAGISFGTGLEAACDDAFAGVLTQNPIPFEPGADQLTAEGETALERVLLVFELCPDLPFEVGGHTDDQGRVATNMSLSQRRAEAIVAQLVANGIDEQRLTARGYGPDRPIASNDTEEGRSVNRRIEIRTVSEGD